MQQCSGRGRRSASNLNSASRSKIDHRAKVQADVSLLQLILNQSRSRKAIDHDEPFIIPVRCLASSYSDWQ